MLSDTLLSRIRKFDVIVQEGYVLAEKGIDLLQ